MKGKFVPFVNLFFTFPRSNCNLAKCTVSGSAVRVNTSNLPFVQKDVEYHAIGYISNDVFYPVHCGVRSEHKVVIPSKRIPISNAVSMAITAITEGTELDQLRLTIHEAYILRRLCLAPLECIGNKVTWPGTSKLLSLCNQTMQGESLVADRPRTKALIIAALDEEYGAAMELKA